MSAHTNGFGDFVLLEELGYPWVVHSCHFDAQCFDAQYDVGRTKNIEVREAVPPRNWDQVEDIAPEISGPRSRRSVLGDVVNIIRGFTCTEPRFLSLPSDSRQQVRRILGDSTPFVEIVTGEGARYAVFWDLTKVPVRARDIVVCDVKGVNLLNRQVFLATKARLLVKGNRLGTLTATKTDRGELWAS